MRKNFIITISILFAFTGCRNTEKRLHRDSPQKLLHSAQNCMNSGAFNSAAEDFKEIADLFCYLSWAPDARIMSAYAFLLAKEYIETLSQIATFETLYPDHPLMDYVLYLKGYAHMCKVRKIATDKRDLPEAMKIFQMLIHRYPQSKYVPHAKQCIQKLEQFYIDSEVIAIQEALNRQYYEQVMNRCQRLLDQHKLVIPAITMYIDACLCLRIDKVASKMLDQYKDEVKNHPELLDASKKIDAYRINNEQSV